MHSYPVNREAVLSAVICSSVRCVSVQQASETKKLRPTTKQ